MTINDELADALSVYAAALHARDLDAVAECFTSGAVVQAPQVPTASGIGVRELYGQIFSAIDLDISFTLEDVIPIGSDRAVVFSESTGTQAMVDGGGVSPEGNREAFVFDRLDDAWKISSYLFNTIQ